MPLHDWTRVSPNTFHHFHGAWITHLSESLNGGLLPKGFYALAEQVAGGPRPDVLALEFDESDDESESRAAGGTALLEAVAPPNVRYTLEAEAAIQASKANHVAIYHSSGDKVVAFIEIVSRGNKRSATAVQQFTQKLNEAFEQGCHLMVIDLFPPGHHDPQGLHPLFWGDDTPTVSAAEPLSLAAYRASAIPRAYFEPLAIGSTLPDFPLFITPERYVYVPLESTYQAAWRGVPDRWKRVIEA